MRTKVITRMATGVCSIYLCCGLAIQALNGDMAAEALSPDARAREQLEAAVQTPMCGTSDAEEIWMDTMLRLIDALEKHTGKRLNASRLARAMRESRRVRKSLGAVFALSSSLVPILLTLALAGSLSVQIPKQLSVWMPRFRLTVYLLFLLSALVGLFS